MRRKKNIYELQTQRNRIIIEATKRLTDAATIRLSCLCLQRTIAAYICEEVRNGRESKFKKLADKQIQELDDLMQHYLHQEQRYQNIIDSIRYFTCLYYEAQERLKREADKTV